MIIDYETPASDATRLTGTITDSGEVSIFECRILFTDGEQDLDATLESVRSNHESAKLAKLALGI